MPPCEGCGRPCDDADELFHFEGLAFCCDACFEDWFSGNGY